MGSFQFASCILITLVGPVGFGIVVVVVIIVMSSYAFLALDFIIYF